MTDSGEFCPNCGDPIEVDITERDYPTSASPRERKLCDSCYFDRFDLVDAPERIEVRVCAQCGAVYRGRRWVDVGARDYTDIAIEEVSEALAVHVDARDVSWQVEPEQIDPNTIRMHCYFSGVVRDTLMEEEIMVPVMIARQTCTRCGRIAGDYYASIVQVRGVDRVPTPKEEKRAKEIANEIVADMEATGDRNAFVTEMDETPDGLNIKVSTTNIGKKISSKLVEEFGGSFSDAETLVTEDEDGNGVYRVTYAVRLPPFTPGDIISPDDDGPVLVRSVQGNLKGRRITTGEEYEAKFGNEDAADARKLGTIDDAEETTLVAVTDERAVQVLDPETYQTETISKPSYMDEDAETVSVFKSRSGLYVVPDA
ncbi:60S ribosomal export protein NMD3 [Haladaptatus sp. CMAA 1911]|uniref:60S ribosomal export protein NMD3 n=1 Tax=unclassified Haladaptatus TaxID=2622732 RepID=UPI0037544D4E